jgi:hypothetical protein
MGGASVIVDMTNAAAVKLPDELWDMLRTIESAVKNTSSQLAAVQSELGAVRARLNHFDTVDTDVREIAIKVAKLETQQTVLQIRLDGQDLCIKHMQDAVRGRV